MTTPATVFAQVRLQCNESSSNSTMWSDGEILRHMSDAELIISQTVPCTEDKTSFLTGDGTREYGLGSNVGPISRLTWDSVRLSRINLNQIDDVEGSAYGGIDSSGSPEFYYLYGSDSTIGFSPIPDSSKSCEIYHFAVPTAIDSTVATTWTIPSRYGPYTGHYALWQMFVKDQQTGEEAVAYQRQWTDDLNTLRHDWAVTKRYDNNQPITIGEDIFIE